MILASAAGVGVAILLLLVGMITSDLTLVYVSIGVSSVAALLLAVGVFIRRELLIPRREPAGEAAAAVSPGTAVAGQLTARGAAAVAEPALVAGHSGAEHGEMAELGETAERVDEMGERGTAPAPAAVASYDAGVRPRHAAGTSREQAHRRPTAAFDFGTGAFETVAGSFEASLAPPVTDGWQASPIEAEPAGAEPAKAEAAETMPAEAIPAEAMPAKAESAERMPAEAMPIRAEPAEIMSAEAMPAKAEPAETMPAEAMPVRAEAAETMPPEAMAEAMPAEAEAAETMPAEAIPAEAMPVRAEPAETMSAEAMPAQAEPADAGRPAAAPAEVGPDATVGGSTDAAADVFPSAESRPRSRAAPANSSAAAVWVVRGVSRYHLKDCVLIQVVDDEDVDQTTLGQAEQIGCTACRACHF